MSNNNSNPSFWEYREGGQELSPDSFDSDSAYENSRLSEITSFASSVTEYRYENGRRYHRYHEGQYVFPNDEKENERLDLQHHLSGLVFGGKLHFSSIRPEGPILDLGTGTGIWAVDMAETYPKAEVIGTDLSQIQLAWVPPNCRFEVDDCELEWVFPENYFELIHTRYLNGSLKDWPGMVRQAYKHTKPGGWIEIQEAYPAIFCDDNTLPPDNPMQEWSDLINKAAEISGRPLTGFSKIKEQITEAGYVGLKEKLFKLPFNAWPKDEKMKEIGRYQCLNNLEGVEGWTMALLTRVLGWEKKQVDELLTPVKKEFKNRQIHAYWRLHIILAQKPDVES